MLMANYIISPQLINIYLTLVLNVNFKMKKNSTNG